MTSQSEVEHEDDEEGTDIVVLASAVSNETWLPKVILAIPVEDPDEEPLLEGCVSVALSPEEALQIGTSLVTLASETMTLNFELQDKSIEERKEIVQLEAQFRDCLCGDCEDPT